MTLIAVAAALAGCGGGGGASGNGSGSHTSGETGAGNPAAPVAGDYTTYKRIITNVEGPTGIATGVVFYETEAVDKVLAGGAFVAAEVEQRTNRSDKHFDANGGLFQSGVGRCQYTHAPALFTDLPRSGQAGMNWNISSTTTLIDPAQAFYCGGGGEKYSGSIVSYATEPVTVGIGSFNALKFQAKYTQEVGQYLRATERTCWMDTAMRINVKCQVIESESYAGKLNFKVTIEYELVGYAKAGAKRRVDSLYRFEGRWTAPYTAAGGAAETCTISVAKDGAVEGNCGGAVSGNVAVDGAISFKPAAGKPGLTFTGKLETPLGGSGSYTMPGASGGTLALSRH
ncbi:hypothetical protein [Pseudoduganella sp.]|uniref:hypothetical protein n=1 Tax=Pseudoduganella sp. TaxID=1880898 RepID=UPI0035B30BD8